MNLDRRIEAFSKLGEFISSLNAGELNKLVQSAGQANPWFTENSVKMALQGVAKFINEKSLRKWLSDYHLDSLKSRAVGVTMAGNIPLVGFHDMLCVLVTGHRVNAKLSSQDAILLPFLARQLVDIEPAFKDRIQFSDRLNQVEAMIATGSDNSARYFEYYFSKIPHIIRKNRSSCAVIHGGETFDELHALGTDVFSYFGLGCRNISKLYVPEKYPFTQMLESWREFSILLDHAKYSNNYHYQKAIFSVNQTQFHDNGFILVKQDDAFVSPMAVMYFESYTNEHDLREKLSANRNKIQCVVGGRKWIAESVDFGQAQFPEVWEYADGVDTVRFLSNL